MNNLRATTRQHLPFLVIMPLIIIVMTWPTVVHIFDRDGFWLVQDNIDSNMLFWDAWYFERVITGQADFFFTDLLFHPAGVSLAYHNFSLPHMALLTALKTVLPPANAFNLAYLLLTSVTAACGYVYLNYLIRDKWIALFGTVVFGASAFIITRPAQIHISFIATVPLSLYFFHRAVLETNRKLMLLAGLLVGATAFIGLYTLVCLLMVVGLYILAFALVRWRSLAYWRSVLLLLLATAVLVAFRLVPMLTDSAGLSGALAKNIDFELGTDLMWYFVNYKHPLLAPLVTGVLPIVDKPGWDRIVFLGYVPLALLGLALWRRKTRARALPWLGLALIFLVLRLGSTLTLNSTSYDHIILPKHFLAEALPFVFKAFWTPDIFHGGALLPFAVVACFGLKALLQSVGRKRRLSVILIFIGAVAFEYYQVQRPFVLPEGRLDFIDWLAQVEDQETIRLINLPLGGQHSKVYAFHQTYGGYPHAEGRPTRTPPNAFDYIERNLLLRNWRAGRTINCLPGNQAEFSAAQDQLLADGFTHIIMHYDRLWRETLEANFVNIPEAYSDEFVSVYRVADLDQSCNISAFLSEDALAQFRLIEQTIILPLEDSSLLSIQPFEAAAGAAQQLYSAVLYNLRGYTPLAVGDVNYEIPPQNDERQAETLSALESNSVILLVYDPQAADSNLVDTYRAWVAHSFTSCGRLADAKSAVIEVFLREGFPCELVHSDAPLSVIYDNGIQLGNLLTNVAGNKLDLYLLWKRLPEDAHAISVQLFNDEGAKALGQDFVFHHDALGKYDIDLSRLEPGRYDARLIVYNYATGASVSGAVLASDERIARELDIKRIIVAG